MKKDDEKDAHPDPVDDDQSGELFVTRPKKSAKDSAKDDKRRTTYHRREGEHCPTKQPGDGHSLDVENGEWVGFEGGHLHAGEGATWAKPEGK